MELGFDSFASFLSEGANIQGSASDSMRQLIRWVEDTAQVSPDVFSEQFKSVLP